MDPRHLARRCEARSALRATPAPDGSAAGSSPAVPQVTGAAVAVAERSARAPRPRGADGRWLSDAAIAAAGSAPDAVVAAPGASRYGNVVALLPDADGVLPLVAGSPGRVRRPLVARRRPALVLAAAVVGAAGIALTAGGWSAPADATSSAQVSVAEEIALAQAEATSTAALDGAAATDRIGEQLANRAAREDALASAAQLQSDADQQARDAAASAAADRAVLPVDGARLSSGFGYRWGTLHAGLDFAAPLGTPEHAAMDGVVLKAGPASGFGLAVYLQHANGDVTVYGHMEQILVAEGQAVKAGDTIALLGNRGQSTGPHLHFEVHVGGIDGEKVDPLPWLRAHGVAI